MNNDLILINEIEAFMNPKTNKYELYLKALGENSSYCWIVPITECLYNKLFRLMGED